MGDAKAFVRVKRYGRNAVFVARLWRPGPGLTAWFYGRPGFLGLHVYRDDEEVGLWRLAVGFGLCEVHVEPNWYRARRRPADA